MRNTFGNFIGFVKKNDWEQPQLLFDALQQRQDKAIQFAQRKTMKTVANLSRFAGLTEMDSEEILNDAVIILLQKIESGAYQFQGHDPCSFLVEIAKRLISNAKRKNQRIFEDIENHFELADTDTERYLESKSNEKILLDLLSQIGENCQKLISLKYLQEFKDEEILEQKMTQYASINTLKVKRSECMKKLSELAKSSTG
jgi:DNA-directed RNA polymerase specialized sigma24 family protein